MSFKNNALEILFQFSNVHISSLWRPTAVLSLLMIEKVKNTMKMLNLFRLASSMHVKPLTQKKNQNFKIIINNLAYYKS